MKRSVLVLLIYLTLLAAVNAQAVTYLVVEHPEQLVILDSYQRLLNTNQKQAWGTFVPLQIDRMLVLPDGISRAYRALWRGRSFYVLLNEKGEVKNLEKSGFHRWYDGVKAISDTVEIVTRSGARLLHPEKWTQLRRVAQGAKLIRFFKKGKYYYVGTLDRPPQFGWVIGSPRLWQKRLKSTPTDNQQKLLQNLRFFVERKNRIYRNFFRFFVSTGNSRIKTSPEPQWEIVAEKEGWRLQFSRPELLKRWPDSRALFKSELQNLVAASGFKVEDMANGYLLVPGKK